jgi:hypothetical protein
MKLLVRLGLAAGIALGAGSPAAALQSSTSQPPPAAGQGTSDSIVTILAAGDIAACSGGELATARLVDSLKGQVIVIGDAAYASRRDPNPYLSCFDPSWGTFKERIRPVLGNHDYEPSMIRKYFAYFGEAAGPEPGGYYSFDVGRWHVIALNSNLDTGPRSRQGKWLAEDLAANTSKCTVAIMHHPRFSSGPHAPYWTTRAAFIALDSAQVDVILTAHDHTYERFVPMDVEGKPADDAPRQFVVGTGGAPMYKIKRVEKGSEVHQDEFFGVLKLTLAPDSYEWEFVSVQGQAFRDSGRSACH